MLAHVRPAINTCVRLAGKFLNLFITVYTLAPFEDQGVKYLATYPEPVAERVRVAASALVTPILGLMDVLTNMDRCFGPWIARQLARPDVEINGLPVDPPSYIIEDHFNGGVSLINKQYHNLPAASWWAAGAASFLEHFGNAEHGGGWRIIGAISAALTNQEVDIENSVDEILSQELTRRVVRIPGLPPHYEHEQTPQKATSVLAVFVRMYKRWETLSEQTTMVIFSSVYEIESAIAEACHSALTKPLTPFFIGFSADLPRTVPQIDHSSSDPVISFMNRAYSDLGPHSVVYIGFGTIWFPSSGFHLKILIEEILEQGLRLVFSVKGDNLGAIGMDEGFINMITKNNQAIFPEWTNQLEVLEHPAMHYFLSHGGWNSTTEAILREVPLIFWPILGDQPTNAMQFARQLDCGFELLQVRTGVAQSVAYSPNGDVTISGSEEAVRDEIRRVLMMSKGSRGAQQRSNMRSFEVRRSDRLVKKILA
ncbi:glycosyltransferase family 1 protein [Ceratobasidium sp. AG-Ba]|nr:glycosyltransferase family 1 protein [Ceratobasidium sp. AG-Ba]